MAQKAVSQHHISIRLACEIFGVSEICYLYEAKNNAENELIANWLIAVLTRQWKDQRAKGILLGITK
jgi:hypothetical protein